MDQPLPDTTITGNQVQIWLSDYFKRPLKILSCNATKIAAGEGFTSTILRIFLQYDCERSDSLPKSVILKTPSLPALEDLMNKLAMDQAHDMNETIEFMTIGHSIECDAYNALCQYRPMPLPDVYASTHCKDGVMGAILMEDLSDKSSIVGDPSATLSLDQLYRVAESVADWHAWCLTTHVNWQEHFEAADSERRKKMFGDWFQMMQMCFQRTKAKYPNDFDTLDVEMAKNLLDVDKLSENLEKWRSILPDVIVHGDFYLPNLMFEKVKDAHGNVSIGSKVVAIIDWPLSTRGCGMEDFSRLISFSVDIETRRQHAENVLRRYYDILVKKAGADKVKSQFQDVLKLYHDHLIRGGLFFVMMLDWLQNLWVTDPGEVGERKKRVLYERCLALYQDIQPLLAEHS